ncbi:hypothetical protein [Desmospora profundinema]|uniref:Uncharacterized protein n=1 Tax=Desmospora profundinema TaxID=1571184 RepID=A0ABU1ITF0_9BACL|nr:hypothetical protein [Desmospora profundinema]MDR6227469.1 hypothetical protein [Desmospora profundinema]
MKASLKESLEELRACRETKSMLDAEFESAYEEGIGVSGGW